MPLQKIIKFNGRFCFQCLYSGVLLDRCYAYPDYDRVSGRRKNGGSFKDAACAVAWLKEKHKEGKITDKKYRFLITEISKEVIKEKGQDLIAAPEMDPFSPLWEYQADFPWMLAEDLLLDVSTVLEWREEDKKRKEEREKNPQGKPWIYQTLNGTVYPLDHSQFPLSQDSVIHVSPGKGVILEDQDATGSSAELIGNSMGVYPSKDAILILNKKIKFQESDYQASLRPRKKKRNHCLSEGEEEDD